MKHKSFYDEYLKIQKDEIEELRKCLKKHGGSFDWVGSGVDHPIVSASVDLCEYVGDVDVKEIRLEKNGKISMIVDTHDCAFCGLEIGIEDIHLSHIDFIMDYLPEP